MILAQLSAATSPSSWSSTLSPSKPKSQPRRQTALWHYGSGCATGRMGNILVYCLNWRANENSLSCPHSSYWISDSGTKVPQVPGSKIANVQIYSGTRSTVQDTIRRNSVLCAGIPILVFVTECSHVFYSFMWSIINNNLHLYTMVLSNGRDRTAPPDKHSTSQHGPQYYIYVCAFIYTFYPRTGQRKKENKKYREPNVGAFVQ